MTTNTPTNNSDLSSLDEEKFLSDNVLYDNMENNSFIGTTQFSPINLPKFNSPELNPASPPVASLKCFDSEFKSMTTLGNSLEKNIKKLYGINSPCFSGGSMVFHDVMKNASENTRKNFKTFLL